MGKHQFIHTMSTVYYYIPCIKAFKCKKNLTKKEKEKREEEYKKTKKIPTCSLCRIDHWRCKEDNCENCYKLHKCNNIICSYCVKKN